MYALFIPFAILILFTLLADRFGHDSRDTIEDRPQPSLGSSC